MKVLSSTFIGFLFPCENSAEFDSIYQKIRKEHFKSDHIPYAFIGKDSQKSNDDGEPSGAAGGPLLTLLSQKGIINAAIIVVRYFGGTKLGLPRLRKTFLEAASIAIDNATYAQPVSMKRAAITCDYPSFEKLKRFAQAKGYSILESDFGILVNLVLGGDDKMSKELESLAIHFEQFAMLDDVTALREIEDDR